MSSLSTTHTAITQLLEDDNLIRDIIDLCKRGNTQQVFLTHPHGSNVMNDRKRVTETLKMCQVNLEIQNC